MPRPWSNDLQNILKSYRRRDTLDIYLNNGTTLRLSRGKVIRGANTYQNWIRSVDELRFSTESSIDRITVTCQNVNSSLGFNLASNLRLLDYALADYGKIYESLRIPGLVDDVPQVFRGVLANAESDEQNISFELIVDYESVGAVVASRALSPRCWWTYKNGVECTSTSGETTCPQTRSACVKRGVEKDFGGWEAFIEPISSPPGSGGNGGGIGGGSCFTLDTPIWTPDGDIPIGELRAGQRIVSFNEKTGELNLKDEIIEVLDHETTGYYTFSFDHGELNVTPEHPLLVANNIFVLADMLRLGDTVRVVKQGWEDSGLRSIRWNSDARVKVRNLQVRGNQTYFANRCAVHNVKQLPL
jgi:hypothetical protein